ncbi:restriction endonuclease [Deinococcus sp.]|uniref:restriction endonuclease n=1 Tax=Deinococcus sp. TaxID=47478 RepID=UPI003C7A7BD0
MPNLYCVRADYGKYTQDFLDGGFVAYGLMNDRDLSGVPDKEALYPIYKEVFPSEENNHVIGKGVGQLARFLFEMKAGDHVLTRAEEAEFFHWGVIVNNSYEFAVQPGHCPYPHRRKVKWNSARVRRSDMSVPLQNTMRSLLSVFTVEAKSEFFELIGKREFVEAKKSSSDAYEVALERVLTLTDKEFEELVVYLLTAMGFEETQHTGKTGDGGVDAQGTLDVGGLARIALKVQAKRLE